MFCPVCGAQIPDGSAYCNNCGTQFSNQQFSNNYSESNTVYSQPTNQDEYTPTVLMPQQNPYNQNIQAQEQNMYNQNVQMPQQSMYNQNVQAQEQNMYNQNVQIPQQNIYNQNVQAQEQNMYNPGSAPSAPKAKKSGKKLAIIATVCVLAIAGGVTAVLLSKKGKKSSQKANALTVNGKDFDMSSTDFINSLSDMPLAVQVNNSTRKGREEGTSDPKYYRAKGYKLTDEEISEEEAGAIFGYYMGLAEVGEDNTISKINFVEGATDILAIKGLIKIDDDITVTGMGYNNHYGPDADNELNLYGCIKLSFIDNYKMDGLDKESSKEDIEKSGYKPSAIEDIYYDIYSPAGVDWDAIQNDYEDLKAEKLNNAEVMRDAYKGKIDYGPELLASYGLINSPLCNNDKNRDLSISGSKDLYKEITKQKRPDNSYKYNKEYDDYALSQFAFAKQMHLLNTGEIDYFIVKEFDTTSAKADGYSNQGGAQGGPYFTYSDNVASIYIITKEDNYRDYMDDLGWFD